MAYGKNGATCWQAGAVRTLQKRVAWLVAATTGANTSVSRHKFDGDFKIQDTIPMVRVPRHRPAGDLVYDSKTSGIRGPRPKGVAERVVQFSPVRGRVILNWPERIKTQPHDDRDNCFLPFDSKGPCGMTVNNDIDDDSATKHSDSHTRNSHRQSV